MTSLAVLATFIGNVNTMRRARTMAEKAVDGPELAIVDRLEERICRDKRIGASEIVAAAAQEASE